MALFITVKEASNTLPVLSVCTLGRENSVGELKEVVSERLNLQTAAAASEPDAIKLIFAGKLLQNKEVLADVFRMHDSGEVVVHLIVKASLFPIAVAAAASSQQQPQPTTPPPTTTTSAPAALATDHQFVQQQQEFLTQQQQALIFAMQQQQQQQAAATAAMSAAMSAASTPYLGAGAYFPEYMQQQVQGMDPLEQMRFQQFMQQQQMECLEAQQHWQRYNIYNHQMQQLLNTWQMAGLPMRYDPSYVCDPASMMMFQQQMQQQMQQLMHLFPQMQQPQQNWFGEEHGVAEGGSAANHVPIAQPMFAQPTTTTDTIAPADTPAPAQQQQPAAPAAPAAPAQQIDNNNNNNEAEDEDDDWNWQQRREPAWVVAIKLSLIVFLIGRDMPTERFYWVLGIALVVFLQQIGFFARRGAAVVPVGGGGGGAAGNDGETEDNNNNPPAPPARAFEDIAGARMYIQPGSGSVVKDLFAVVAGFFSSLIPAPFAE